MARIAHHGRLVAVTSLVALLLLALAACDNGGEDPAADPTATEPAAAAPTATEEPAAMPGEGVTVQPARATWDTGYFQEAVYSLALEELGYDVQDHQELDAPLFYQSVAQGDVHFWANGWFPLHDQYRDIFEQGAEIVGTLAAAGALEGYLVDAAGAEEFDINTVEDLKRPEVKEAYDRDGDGLADLVACPPGWGCETVIEHQLDAYELRDHVNDIKAGYAVAMGDAIAAYESGEHILFYTWTPNWTVNELVPGEDVVWIEVPSGAHPGDEDEESMRISGVEGCVDGNDPCFMGWPANDINVVANTAFLDSNPAAATIIESIEIPLADIFAQNARMNAGENTQADIDGHAQEWAEENSADWEAWLEEARAAAAN